MKNSKSQLSFILLAVLLVFVSSGITKSKTYGYLGVSIEKLTKIDKEDLNVDWGVLVTEVVSNSPAEKAGINEDDVIQYYKDDKVESTSDLIEMVRKTPASEKVLITLIRDEKKKDVYAVIAHKRQRQKNAVQWFSGDGGSFEFNKERGYLGVQLHDLNEDLASYFHVKPDEGVLVLIVMRESPAEEAGLKPGDVIVQVDGEKVNAASVISELISEKESDEEVKIVLLRHRKKMTVNVTLSASQIMNRIMIKTGSDCEHEEIIIPEIHMDMQRENLIRHEEHMKELQEKMKDMKQKIKVRKKGMAGATLI